MKAKLENEPLTLPRQFDFSVDGRGGNAKRGRLGSEGRRIGLSEGEIDQDEVEVSGRGGSGIGS
jgi:hypothetical protein